MQLQAQTPGQGGYGGFGTLPNMKPMPQVDPNQDKYAQWYQQVTSQGYTPMYRSPLDGKPYQVDPTGLRTAVDERQFQTVYPSELGNTGGSQWGGPQAATLQPASWNVPAGSWAKPMQASQPQALPPMAQYNPLMGDPVGFGGAPGMVAAPQQGMLQNPALQQQMANFFTRNLDGTQYAMAQQSGLNDAMMRRSAADMSYGTGWGGALGGLMSFFTGDPGYSQYAEKQADNAYKRRQELAGNTNNLVNNAQQNITTGFNMLMQSDPQSIKNQTAMANALANMQRANAYGQSINNNMMLGQDRSQLGWAQLAQRDRQFAQTAQQAQQRLQMDMQRVQLEGQRVGLSQQDINLRKQQIAQQYDLGLQRLAQDAQASFWAHSDRQAGIQQDYDKQQLQEQQFWAGLQNENYQKASEQGRDPNTQQSYYKYSEDYRKQFTGPPKKLVDLKVAEKYLQQAGGDRSKARELARQDGWIF
jgi:hypothetical protein